MIRLNSHTANQSSILWKAQSIGISIILQADRSISSSKGRKYELYGGQLYNRMSCRLNRNSIFKLDGRRIVPLISILNVLWVGLSIERVAKLICYGSELQIFTERCRLKYRLCRVLPCIPDCQIGKGFQSCTHSRPEQHLGLEPRFSKKCVSMGRKFGERHLPVVSLYSNQRMAQPD